MINFEALFNVSYGLYIISSGFKNEPCGFIANAAFQITAEPPQFAVCCNKNNFSANIIKNTGAFALSVLHQEASSEIIGTFGYKSGKDVNKFENIGIKYGETGVPLVIQDALSVLEFKLVQTFDVGTHFMFIGELISSEVICNNKEPLTYAFYRNVKKGLAPKNAPTYIDKNILEKNLSQSPATQIMGSSYKCMTCGYLYTEEKEGDFEALPHDWVCPICNVTKDDFIKL